MKVYKTKNVSDFKEGDIIFCTYNNSPAVGVYFGKTKRGSCRILINTTKPLDLVVDKRKMNAKMYYKWLWGQYIVLDNINKLYELEKYD